MERQFRNAQQRLAEDLDHAARVYPEVVASEDGEHVSLERCVFSVVSSSHSARRMRFWQGKARRCRRDGDCNLESGRRGPVDQIRFALRNNAAAGAIRRPVDAVGGGGQRLGGAIRGRCRGGILETG